MTRQQSYRQRLHQFARSYVTMDLRDPSETRLARATAYERRYKTAGKPSAYAIGAPQRVETATSIWLRYRNADATVADGPIAFAFIDPV